MKRLLEPALYVYKFHSDYLGKELIEALLTTQSFELDFVCIAWSSEIESIVGQYKLGRIVIQE